MGNSTAYSREYYRLNAARLNARRAAWRWACWLVHEVLFAPEEPAQAVNCLPQMPVRRPLLTLRSMSRG